MSDSKSQATSRSGKKGIDKHCNGAGCNGKKISASYWSDHKKQFKHEDGVSFSACSGADCKICQDHACKLSQIFVTHRVPDSATGSRILPLGPGFCHWVPDSATLGPGFCHWVPDSATLGPGFCHSGSRILPLFFSSY
jgi:hypothetical protein